MSETNDFDAVVMCNCPLCGAPRKPKHDISWAEGLSVRAANALIADGLQSKAEVKELIKQHRGRGLRWVPNIGTALEKEIKEWAAT